MRSPPFAVRGFALQNTPPLPAKRTSHFRKFSSPVGRTKIFFRVQNTEEEVPEAHAENLWGRFQEHSWVAGLFPKGEPILIRRVAGDVVGEYFLVLGPVAGAHALVVWPVEKIGIFPDGVTDYYFPKVDDAAQGQWFFSKT